MNKNKGFPFLRGGVRRGLLLLLMLLPLCGFAQTLTQYEYWFDDDFAGRRIASLSGKEKDLTVTIDTYFWETGMHRLSLRVKQSDGHYSAITTSSFIKLPTGETQWLEYWFDGNQENSKRIAGTKASDGNGYVFNSEVDLSGLPVGIHQLYYRAVSDDGLVSTAVSVSPFLKLVSGEAKWLEYWFDGNQENSKRIAGTKASDGNGYVFNSEVDLSGLPVGIHQLYYRAVSDDGLVGTAVSVSPFLKLVTGEAKWLEYWFDGDRANKKRIAGTKATDGNGYVFNNELDVSGLDPGHHRLYYRAVSDNGLVSTSVSTSSVVVKLLAEMSANANKATMKSFSYAIDNEEPITINVQGQNDELNLDPYTINVRDLKAGDHTLKVHFWNSANAGVSLEQKFKVAPLETPEIQLTAEIKDGLVNLKFNSIPNDVGWRVARYDANGARAQIAGKSYSVYPSTILVTDNPPIGEYTYVARSLYTDVDGIHAISSNNVKVNVVETQSNLLGNIIGSIKVNGKVLRGQSWKITFSDGVTLETDVNGSYYRENIPVGTTLEITAQARDYSCEPVSVTIKKGTNDVVHNGKFDETLIRSRYSYDLVIASNYEFEPRKYIKFKVKNPNRLPWNGKVRIVTGRKDFVDNLPKNPYDFNQPSNSQVLAGSVAPFVLNESYQYDYSEELSIPSGSTADVYIVHHLPFNPLPMEKDELYYFFVESIDMYGSKLVQTNDDFNFKKNPIVQLIDMGQYNAEKEMEEKIETCIGFIMALCSTVKEFDGRLGDMSRCMAEMEETLGYTLDYDDLAGKMQREGWYTYIHDAIPSWKFYQILYHEDRRFLSMVNSVRDKIAKEVRLAKDVLDYTQKVQKCIDVVKDYDQWQDMTDLERAGSIAKKILSLNEKQFPFAKILKTYLDVTETTIKNINGLAQKWYDNHDYGTFYNGEGIIYSGSDFKFDIKVKKNNWRSSPFDADIVKNNILSAEICCIGRIPGNAPLKCVATYTPEVQDGIVRLKRVGITGIDVETGSIVPIEDMWMTIWWSNGRVSYVPLRNSSEMKGNGVKHDKNHFTITFQSHTKKEEYMADIINLDD